MSSRSFIYLYPESALSVLTPNRAKNVKEFQGHTIGMCVLHTRRRIPGDFEDKAQMIVRISDSDFIILKDETPLMFDERSVCIENSIALPTMERL